MPIREHLANGIVGPEQSGIARAATNHRELACPRELSVIGINLKPCRRWGDVLNFLDERVTPILRVTKIEGHADKFVGLRVVGIQLLARADRSMVPIIDAVTIEVGLRDFGPEFARV